MVTDPPRTEDLALIWEFRPDGGRWGPIEVPAPWQRAHPGFHGRGVYRTVLPRVDDGPFLIRFEAVATEARVLVNGDEAGRHTGAWTPFIVDVTPYLTGDPDRPDRFEVEVDEKPGHLTEGFLPVIGGAFGGIWGAVQRLLWEPERGSAEPPAGTTVSANPFSTAESRPVPDEFPGADLPSGGDLRVEGSRIVYDGRPLALRGMLHWGYYPELGAPSPSREMIDSEIAAFRAFGFNLIKFCLVFPPERYLDACDAAGMHVWIEYPVWNQPLRDGAFLAELEEFLQIDSRHPSVIIRTLTCENDCVDADLARRACTLVRRYAPRGLVLDNSGWVSTEKAGDFHDEHPYLHNAEWRYYAARMRRALADREEKPLLLGETMAVDTWTDLDAAPAFPPDYAESQRALEAEASFSGVMERSCRIADGVRKYQIETLRRELPGTGYVMNVARDIPSAPLGFFRVDGSAKLDPRGWSWHGDTMVVSDLEERSFSGGEWAKVGLFVSHFGREPLEGVLRCRMRGEEWGFAVDVGPGGTERVGEIAFEMPVVEKPERFRLEAHLDGGLDRSREGSSEMIAENGWNLWAVPAVEADALPLVDRLDDSALAVLRGGESRIQVAGPRRGSWKCPAFTWWNPVIRFDGDVLPEELVEDLIVHDLLSGRVLAPDEALVPLLEVCDVHMEGKRVARHPLVAVACGPASPPGPPGVLCLSALRHDTPAGRYLLKVLAGSLDQLERGAPVPIAPADSLLLTEWEMSLDGGSTVTVKCDTPLVNGGKTIFEGWATFRTAFRIPDRWEGCDLLLCCDSVADAFRVFIDGREVGVGGNPDATWDGTRDRPCEFPLRLDAGGHTIRIEARDWRGGGGMIGPVRFTRTPQSNLY